MKLPQIFGVFKRLEVMSAFCLLFQNDLSMPLRNSFPVFEVAFEARIINTHIFFFI